MKIWCAKCGWALFEDGGCYRCRLEKGTEIKLQLREVAARAEAAMVELRMALTEIYKNETWNLDN